MSPLESLPGHTLRMVSFAEDFVELGFEPPPDSSAVVIEFSADRAEEVDPVCAAALTPVDADYVDWWVCDACGIVADGSDPE